MDNRHFSHYRVFSRGARTHTHTSNLQRKIQIGKKEIDNEHTCTLYQNKMKKSNQRISADLPSSMITKVLKIPKSTNKIFQKNVIEILNIAVKAHQKILDTQKKNLLERKRISN